MAVRKQIGLLEYLEKRLGSYRPVGTSETEWFCPFCIDRMGSESSERKLYVNVAKGKAYCFRCAYGASDLLSFFRSLNGGTLRYEELSILRGEISAPSKISIRESIEDILFRENENDSLDDLLFQPLPEEIVWLTDSQAKRGSPGSLGRRYLRKRGIGQRLTEKFHIGFCPEGTHAGHLIFPVEQGGEIVYWTTRSTWDRAKQKSKNPVNKEGYYSRKHCLFNYDGVVGAKVVAISEGPFDAMAHRHAVGLLGKSISGVQAALLKALVDHGTEEFVVSLDAGTGMEADRIYRALSGRVPKVTILALDHGDPDDRRGELRRLMKTRAEPTLRDRTKQRLKK